MAWKERSLPNTWWIDSRATIHLSVTMQSYLQCRKPSDVKILFYLGDGNKVSVEVIGVYRLKLDSRFYLDLDGTFYVTSFR